MTDTDYNLAHVQENGFNWPLLFKDKGRLGIVIPNDDFTINDVRRCVGSRRMLDVMDVNTQKNVEMTMKDWQRYFESQDKDKLLNVISLEFSHTRLESLIQAPTVVRQVDWVERVWPRHLKEAQTEATNVLEDMMYPKVQKYCLMSVRGCYTDFHIDFGGTSVWYHVLRGKKIFWLIPPTERNLQLYEQWVLSGKQSDIFFGDTVDKCARIELYKGNTFFIPTGWIHAVYTPEDSLVFGGNFLHSFGIEKQLRVAQVEDATHVPSKFRYPFFTEMLWYVLERYVHVLLGRTHLALPPDEHEKYIKYLASKMKANNNNQLNEEGKEGEEPKLELSTTIPPDEHIHLTQYELHGLKAIVMYLHALPTSKKCVPELITDPIALIRDVRTVVEKHRYDKPELSRTSKPVLDWWAREPTKFGIKRPLGENTGGGIKRRRRNSDENRIVGLPPNAAKVRHRRVRCKLCESCQREDCKQCVYCLDMVKYGGPGTMKQTCKMKKCSQPMLPAAAVCYECQLDGWERVSCAPPQKPPSNSPSSLFECCVCFKISHLKCISSKYPDADGVVNEDLPNSWECPECVKEGYNKEYKHNRVPSSRGSAAGSDTGGVKTPQILSEAEDLDVKVKIEGMEAESKSFQSKKTDMSPGKLKQEIDITVGGLDAAPPHMPTWEQLQARVSRTLVRPVWIVRPNPPPPDEEEEEEEEDEESGSDGESRPAARELLLPAMNRTVMLPVFQHLSVRDLKAVMQVCRTWAQWAINPSLWKTINLSHKRVGVYQLEGIVRRQPCCLDLSWARVTAEQLAWLLARLPQLKELHLEGQGWEVISCITSPYCPALSKLNLSYCEGLTDNTLTTLLSAPRTHRPGHRDTTTRLRQLTDLYLAGTQVGDEGVRAIVRSLPFLSTLDLSSCLRITELSAALLAHPSSVVSHSISSLDLRGCHRLAPTCLPSLTCLPLLTRLALHPCSRIPLPALRVWGKSHDYTLGSEDILTRAPPPPPDPAADPSSESDTSSHSRSSSPGVAQQTTQEITKLSAGNLNTKKELVCPFKQVSNGKDGKENVEYLEETKKGYSVPNKNSDQDSDSKFNVIPSAKTKIVSSPLGKKKLDKMEDSNQKKINEVDSSKKKNTNDKQTFESPQNKSIAQKGETDSASSENLRVSTRRQSRLHEYDEIGSSVIQVRKKNTGSPEHINKNNAPSEISKKNSASSEHVNKKPAISSEQDLKCSLTEQVNERKLTLSLEHISKKNSSPTRQVSKKNSSPNRQVSKKNTSPNQQVSKKNTSPTRQVSKKNISPIRQVSKKNISPTRQVSKKKNLKSLPEQLNKKNATPEQKPKKNTLLLDQTYKKNSSPVDQSSKNNILSEQVTKTNSSAEQCSKKNSLAEQVSQINSLPAQCNENNLSELITKNVTFPEQIAKSSSTEQGYLKNSSPEQSSKQNLLPEQGSKKNTLPEQGSKKNTAPEQGSKKNTLLEQGSKKNTLPEQGSKKSTLPEQGSKKNTLPEQGSKKNTLPEQGSKKNTLPEQGSKKNTLPEQGSKKNTLPEQGSKKNTSPEQCSKMNTSPEHGSKKNTAPEQGSKKNTSPEQCSKKNTSPEQGSKKSTAPEQGSKKNTSPEWGSKKNTAPEQGSQKNTSPEQGSQKNTSPEQGSKKNTSPEQGSKKNLAPEQGSIKNLSSEQSFKKNSLPEENSKECSSPDQGSKKNSPPEEGSKESSSPGQGSKKNSPPEEGSKKNSSPEHELKKNSTPEQNYTENPSSEQGSRRNSSPVQGSKKITESFTSVTKCTPPAEKMAKKNSVSFDKNNRTSEQDTSTLSFTEVVIKNTLSAEQPSKTTTCTETYKKGDASSEQESKKRPVDKKSPSGSQLNKANDLQINQKNVIITAVEVHRADTYEGKASQNASVKRPERRQSVRRSKDEQELRADEKREKNERTEAELPKDKRKDQKSREEEMNKITVEDSTEKDTKQQSPKKIDEKEKKQSAANKRLQESSPRVKLEKDIVTRSTKRLKSEKIIDEKQNEVVKEEVQKPSESLADIRKVSRRGKELKDDKEDVVVEEAQKREIKQSRPASGRKDKETLAGKANEKKEDDQKSTKRSRPDTEEYMSKLRRKSNEGDGSSDSSVVESFKKDESTEDRVKSRRRSVRDDESAKTLQEKKQKEDPKEEKIKASQFSNEQPDPMAKQNKSQSESQDASTKQNKRKHEDGEDTNNKKSKDECEDSGKPVKKMSEITRERSGSRERPERAHRSPRRLSMCQ